MLPAFVADAMYQHGMHTLQRPSQRTLQDTFFHQETIFAATQSVRDLSKLNPAVEQSLEQGPQRPCIRVFTPHFEQGRDNVMTHSIRIEISPCSEHDLVRQVVLHLALQPQQ